MSVENFFPKHYPWQRLLVNIAEALEEDEGGKVYMTDIAFEDDLYSFVDMTAKEAYDAMQEGILLGRLVISENEYSYYVFLNAEYDAEGEYPYMFTAESEDVFVALSDDEYPWIM